MLPVPTVFACTRQMVNAKLIRDLYCHMETLEWSVADCIDRELLTRLYLQTLLPPRAFPERLSVSIFGIIVAIHSIRFRLLQLS